MNKGSLRVLFAKHLLPSSFKFLPNRVVDSLEALKLQFRIIIWRVQGDRRGHKHIVRQAFLKSIQNAVRRFDC